jgi:hypothetical protein
MRSALDRYPEARKREEETFAVPIDRRRGKDSFVWFLWMDPDFNKYDLNHRVSQHPIMSDETWEKVYFDSWRQFYTPEHVETVLRRDAARGRRTSALYSSVVHFLGSILIEKVHPLECGIFRRKIRKQRRPGMEVENPIVFYPRRVLESLAAGVRWGLLFLKFRPP